MGGVAARTFTSANGLGAGRRVPGVHLGVVTDNDDPRRIGRVRVRVNALGGSKELAWAKPPMPVGGEQTGVFVPLNVGAQVLVTFEANDINRPVILGAWWPQVSEESTIPLAARGEEDDVRDARGQDTGTGAGGASLQEPDDPFSAGYPFNFVFKSPAGGHLIEVDDTEGAERISITHGPSKSWLEFHPDGSIVIGSAAKRYVLVETDNQEHVKGNQDVLVDGDTSHKTGGDHNEEFVGDVTRIVSGDVTETFQGDVTKTVLGDVNDTHQADTVETRVGDVTKTLSSKFTATITGAVMITLGAAMMLTGQSVALTVSTLTVAASAITLGSAGGGLALMNENALALLNANVALYNVHGHTAPNGADPPPIKMIPLPNAPGVDKTLITKAL